MSDGPVGNTVSPEDQARLDRTALRKANWRSVLTPTPLTDNSEAVVRHFREVIIALGEEIMDLVPEGRDQSLALTNLQQASMWLNHAITHPEG